MGPAVILICVAFSLLFICICLLCFLSARAISERRRIENNVKALSELYGKDSDEFRSRLELSHQEFQDAAQSVKHRFESLDSHLNDLSSGQVRERERVETSIKALSESYGENTSELRSRIESYYQEFLDSFGVLSQKLESLGSHLNDLSSGQVRERERVETSIKALSESHGENTSELRSRVESYYREFLDTVGVLSQKLEMLAVPVPQQVMSAAAFLG